MTTYDDTATRHEPADRQGGESQESSSREARRDKVQEAGREIAHKMQETGRDVAQKAREVGEQGKDMASEYYQQGRAQALVWQEHLEQHIREKPMQSLAIAGGIGLLLGLLWRR